MSQLTGDRKLLEQFRKGEAEALTTVYRIYSPQIAAMLSRGFSFNSKGTMLRFSGFHQPFDLENALQETFVRAFSDQARMAYDGVSPYRRYLSAIARNYVLSELRRREVAMSALVQKHADSGQGATQGDTLTGDDPEQVAQTTVLDGETKLLHEELVTLYREFIAQLAPSDQTFFVARFEQCLPQAEAGQQAGLSLMQARTREKRLRKRFLSYMQARGYLEGYSTLYTMALTMVTIP